MWTPKRWLCQLPSVLFLGDLRTLRETGMCSACDMQITHNSIAEIVYLNHIFQLPCVGSSQIPHRLQDNFPCSELPRTGKRKVSNKRDRISSRKCLGEEESLLHKADFRHCTLSASTLLHCPKLWQHEGAVGKTVQHFQRATVVQKLWCPWARSPKKTVTSRLLGSRAVFRRETNL